jgi:hypothetical protein
MPSIKRWFDDSACQLLTPKALFMIDDDGRGSSAWPLKKNAPHVQILDTKEAWVKFKEHIIIRSRTMNRKDFLRLEGQEEFCLIRVDDIECE